MSKDELKQIGVFATIPFVMAIPPALGWIIGRFLDEHLGTKPFCLYLFIILGFVAGLKEVYRLIKRYGNSD